MSRVTWWQPGGEGGLVSRAWAQVYVFPMPRLKQAELDASIRFKVQAMLPSQDVEISTQSFEHSGQVYGLAIVDRFPDPRPSTKSIRVGHPVLLPKSWPKDCLLTVRSPEGWETHCFEQGELISSYPPIPHDSVMFNKIRQQHASKVLLAIDPANLGGKPPAEATAAPIWPARLPWGVSWTPAKPRHYRILAGVVMGTVGLFLVGMTAVQSLSSVQSEVSRWKDWVENAQQRLASDSGSTALSKDQQRLVGFDMAELLSDLSQAWPEGVKVTRLEVEGGKISLTARATSALSAVTKLKRSTLLSTLKVTQIRPVSGSEEFDMEGNLAPCPAVRRSC